MCPQPLRCYMGCPRGQSLGQLSSPYICCSLWLYSLSLLRRRHSAISLSETRWFQQPSHSPQLFSRYKRLDATQLSLTQLWQNWASHDWSWNTSNSILHCIRPLAPYVKLNSRNLGTIFDSQLKIKHHVNKLVQSCFIQFRNIAKIRPLLPADDIQRIIHAFIFFSSRLLQCTFHLS